MHNENWCSNLIQSIGDRGIDFNSSDTMTVNLIVSHVIVLSV